MNIYKLILARKTRRKDELNVVYFTVELIKYALNSKNTELVMNLVKITTFD